MTAVTVEPIILSNVELSIGADDYAAHVSSVTLTPTYPTVSWKGLAPGAVVNKAGKATWTLALNFAQDWTTPTSLARYLFAHDGEVKTFTFQPEAGTDAPTWTVDAQCLAGAIGGAIDTVPTGTVTLPCQGSPVPDWDNDPLTPNPAE
jgi:hypothetical protein